MSIYLDNGYLNIEKVLSYKQPFNFIVGGRGTGKTFGLLQHVYLNNIRFMLMRRTQAQCDLINKPEFNPFKAVCSYLDIDIKVKSISKYNSMFIEEDDETFNVLGYTCALSTIANMRGFDASDVELLGYDEFVPERHERLMKNEGSAFLNAYETINRNRELQGRDPLQVLCMANAFNMANPIFLELGLVGICEKMIQKNQEFYLNREKGILIILLRDSQISAKKRETALYKITSGSYADMALSNDFAYNDTSNIGSKALKEFRLMCSVGEISIYRHKSDSRFYVSEHRTGSADQYDSDEVGLLRYRKKYGIRLYSAYMRNNIDFETMLAKSLFEIYNGVK